MEEVVLGAGGMKPTTLKLRGPKKGQRHKGTEAQREQPVTLLVLFLSNHIDYFNK